MPVQTSVRITRAAEKRNLGLILEGKLLLAERSLEELARRVLKLPDELQLDILTHLAVLQPDQYSKIHDVDQVSMLVFNLPSPLPESVKCDGQEVRVREELQPKAQEVLMKTATFHLDAKFHQASFNHPEQDSGRLRALAPHMIIDIPAAITHYDDIRDQLRNLFLTIQIHGLKPLAKKTAYYPRNLYDAQDHLPYLKNWLPQVKKLHVLIDAPHCGLNNKIRRNQYLSCEDRRKGGRYTDTLTETFRLRGRMMEMSDDELVVRVRMRDFNQTFTATTAHGRNFTKIPGQDMMNMYLTTASEARLDTIVP
ncbi:hypothetical protein LTR37_001529 [Vermiconidia calcicola]|uniref:Uncharacterized protein n=1 Tax=Vermiconidia calcicola TaxID=1690605 RepID=A0ACC3NVF8_9PEZI|nr:hypothetical protein LTR37_001529 [Vermiconidia calcicola]